MEYYSPRKMKFPSKWVVLESLILREITQSEKDKKKKKKHVLSHTDATKPCMLKFKYPKARN